MVIEGEEVDGDPFDPESVRGEAKFDFDEHRKKAVDEYQSIVATYREFSRVVGSILQKSIDEESIVIHSIESREKDVSSFATKVSKPSDDDPNRPKYPKPLSDITDLAAARVITFFLSSVSSIEPLVYAEFDVIERSDKSEVLEREERFGYHSVHYLVKLKANRCNLPEYRPFAGLVAEVQLRTILQHAWAEIEHDVQYKAKSSLPSAIRRRFVTLAGLLEIADREFENIQIQDRVLKDHARELVENGQLQEVEVTPDSLKSYLDRKYGRDGRISEFSYAFSVRVLKRLGFETLAQVDEAISGYDDDRVSRSAYGNRQGQINRFEAVVLAAMGQKFAERHPWGQEDDDWYRRYCDSLLERMNDDGIRTGSYDPRGAQRVTGGIVNASAELDASN